MILMVPLEAKRIAIAGFAFNVLEVMRLPQ